MMQQTWAAGQACNYKSFIDALEFATTGSSKGLESPLLCYKPDIWCKENSVEGKSIAL